MRSSRHTRDPRRILVVEGYMDVVALGQYDIDYAVAALGTATTSDHIHTLFRTTAEVVCCYDGDNAGREAAWRALITRSPTCRTAELGSCCRMARIPTTLVRQIGKEGSSAARQGPAVCGFHVRTPRRDAAGEAGKFEVATRPPS